MAIRSLKNGTFSRSLLIGNAAFEPTAFESIATTTLSTNTATVTFSSIPQDYKHLQLRVMARTTRSAGPDILGLYMNGNTAAEYADHLIYGDGASAQLDQNINYQQINVQRLATANSGSNIFSGIIINILDYASTDKFKTIRYLGGFDANGSGRVGLGSGLWRNTNGVSSLSIFSLYSENYTQYSRFALFGIKG